MDKVLISIIAAIAFFLLWKIYLFYAFCIALLIALYPISYLWGKVMDFIEGKDLD